jgi:hypothetical protein
VKAQGLVIKLAAKSRLIPVFIFLAGPSLYLLLAFPPLWRDSDGFYQVYDRLGEMTILHWPPLYCILARIPIALGGIITAYLSGQGFPGFLIFPPNLTDLGILLLILSQHILLITTLLFICISLAESAIVRILVAAVFVLSPPLYAFAHSVGSESLSNVLTLLVAALSYRWLRYKTASQVPVFCLGAALVAAILTRHVNAILIALMPGTCLAAFACTLNIRPQGSLSNTPFFGRPYVRQCFQFLLVGGLSLLCANLIVLGLCRLAKTPYRSKVGSTFGWRLFYLASLSTNSQDKVLRRIDESLADPAASYALNKGRELLARNSWDAAVLHRALYEWLADHQVGGWKRLRLETDKKLNRIAWQFLFNGGGDFWRMVGQDFWTSLKYSPADICRDAFRTTDLFVRMSSGPSFAAVRGLSTLQMRRESYESQWSRDPYLTLGKGIPIWAIIVAVGAGTLWLLLFRRPQPPESSLFPWCVILTGLTISLANCVLTFLLARFALPLYLLTLFGLAIVLAHLCQFWRPTNGISAAPSGYDGA